MWTYVTTHDKLVLCKEREDLQLFYPTLLNLLDAAIVTSTIQQVQLDSEQPV